MIYTATGLGLGLGGGFVAHQGIRSVFYTYVSDKKNMRPKCPPSSLRASPGPPRSPR